MARPQHKAAAPARIRCPSQENMHFVVGIPYVLSLAVHFSHGSKRGLSVIT